MTGFEGAEGTVAGTSTKELLIEDSPIRLRAATLTSKFLPASIPANVKLRRSDLQEPSYTTSKRSEVEAVFAYTLNPSISAPLEAGSVQEMVAETVSST